MADKFYPTPSDVKCYVNGIELDDMYRVDFKREVRHQPIYGYDDQKWGFVAKGKELVTGQIVLNYRYPGYLTSVLKEAARSKVREKDAMSPFDPGFFKLDPNTDKYDQAALDGLSSAEKAAFVANVIQSAGSNQDLVDQLKRRYSERFIPGDSEVKATVYDSPLDRGTDQFTFDMTIRYGFQDRDQGYWRVFQDCVIIGESSVLSSSAGAGNDMSSSAQPVFEIYPFFCKSIRVRTNGGRSENSDISELREGLR